MFSVSETIDIIRIELGDVRLDQKRWSDQLLIHYFNECQLILARKNFLRTRTYIPLKLGDPVYSLPDNALKLMKVVYEGKDIPIVSHDYMDRKCPEWYTKTGQTVKTVVFDKFNKGKFRTFPIPYGDINIEVPPTGVTTGTTPPFGVVTGVDIQDEILVEGNLLVYYSYKPNKIQDINDNCEFPEEYQFLFRLYLVGMALRNNLEAQDRTLGAENLQLFYNNLADIEKDIKKEYSLGADLQTEYFRV